MMRLRRLLAIFAICLFGWVFWHSQRMIRADLGSAEARQAVALWVAGIREPSTEYHAASFLTQIDGSVVLISDDADYLVAQGDAYMAASVSDFFGADFRKASLIKAINSYQDSLALRPASAQSWASLASAKYLARASATEVHEAWEKARKYGPYEGEVQPMLMDLALADWEDSTSAMKDWVIERFQSASENSRDEIRKMAKARGLKIQIDDQ